MTWESLVHHYMGRRARRVSGAVLAGLMALGGAALVHSSQPQPVVSTGWLQWGGPTRDFVVPSPALALTWPAGGPPRVWRRALGDGHSSILAEGDRLYTMYRAAPAAAGGAWPASETVVALDARTGETLWEHSYPARPLNFRFGAGPYSTPLIVGDRVFASGTNNQLVALDKHTGAVLWSHDLVRDFGAQETMIRPAVKAGMSSSPLAFGNTVIVMAGGKPGQSVMAFDQRTGEVVWTGGDFTLSQASPILIDFEGRTQLVALGGYDVNGLDPATGRVLWTHPHDTDGDMNITTPLWDAESRELFLSSGYNGGSRMLSLVAAPGRTVVEEQWFTRLLRIHFGTAVRLDGVVIGSSGDFGPAFVTALDVETGERLWQDRSFARATFLLVGSTLLVLDEDGVMGLARATRDGLEVLARAEVASGRTWTVPTLVGSTLYLRDRESIARYELPAATP